MRSALGFLVALGLLSGGPLAGTARAAADPLLGELMLFGGSFCPRGWANADGQLLPISQFSALFSIFGTMYGGDGRTTFALPDLRGRVPLHTGAGPGLSSRRQGERGGAESVALTEAQLAPHSHALRGTNEVATARTPEGNQLAAKQRISSYQPPNGTQGPVALAPGSIGETGAGAPHDNMPPFVTLRWCVATQGVFPSRN